jgi:hypothetical protein
LYSISPELKNRIAFFWSHRNPVPLRFGFGNPAVPVGPVAFPACSIFKAVDPPPVTAGRRPTITRGLALSANLTEELLYDLSIWAISMPIRINPYNGLIFNSFLKK